MVKNDSLSAEVNNSRDIAEKYSLVKQNKMLWDLFTRKEEYNPILLDRYERFPHYISNSRNILEPEVSKFLINNGWEVEYPENKEFAICLTHDIDMIQSPSSNIITDVAKCLYHFQIKALSKHFYNKQDPLWNFKEIIALEDKYGARSSFYFMGLENGDLDFNYNPEEVINELSNIVDQGWEVGLHGGHGAFNNLNVLKREKDRLEKALGKRVIGYRNHFLRFKVPDTWELLKRAGFKYDTTLGHSYCAGFRNGMCHPFKPFNLNTNKEIDILEIPLVLMDVTLYDAYMRLDAKTAWMLSKHLIDITERYNGVLTILWHNTYMIGDRLKIYNKILDYGRKKNAWMTSGELIEKWWNR